MLSLIIKLFPVWALSFSVFAFFQADFFISKRSIIVPLLMVIMLAMGLSLKPLDFVNVMHNKKAVVLGLILQFSVMPLSALLISWLLGFNAELTLGMVLVGAVAGGTASNVMCYLAGGDVALSITMTACSTLFSVLLTPVILELLMAQALVIPVFSMVMSLVIIVLVPVCVGVLINYFCSRTVNYITRYLPLISMLVIVWIIAIVVALTGEKLVDLGVIIFLAVLLHNSVGLGAGYFVARACGFDEKICRTVAFEVGLQNSGLATALALKFFTPVSAVAASVFSIWHNISGSMLASYWSKTTDNNKPLI